MPSVLSSQQLQAASLLAKGSTEAEAAKVAGVTLRTVQRWKLVPEFAQIISEVNSRAVEATIEATATDIAEQIQALVPKAIGVLHEYLDNPECRASDRLRAVHILGGWAGLNQTRPQSEAPPAEQNLKAYLQFISGSNGNGSTNTSTSNGTNGNGQH